MLVPVCVVTTPAALVVWCCSRRCCWGGGRGGSGGRWARGLWAVALRAQVFWVGGLRASFPCGRWVARTGLNRYRKALRARWNRWLFSELGFWEESLVLYFGSGVFLCCTFGQDRV